MNTHSRHLRRDKNNDRRTMTNPYTIDHKSKTITFHRRITPLIHHSKSIIYLSKKYRDYTFNFDYN